MAEHFYAMFYPVNVHRQIHYTDGITGLSLLSIYSIKTKNQFK